MSQTYIVVAAARIQSWLARTPRLSLIRGASRALHDLTANEAVTELLVRNGFTTDEARVTDDAGNVDGVIVLTVSDGVADEARRLLHRHVRGGLPGLEWSSWRGTADSALGALDRARDEAELLVPELFTVPFAQRCQECGAEVAERTEAVENQQRWLGADCLTRLVSGHAGQTGDYRDLLHIPGKHFPGGFEVLVEVPGLTEARADRYQGKQNHLAVVAADGNGVGALFDQINRLIANGTVGEGFRSKAASALDGATRDALQLAASAITDPHGESAVEPHFVGGDDVLVSVPAPLVWVFVISLAKSFQQFLQEELADSCQGEGELATLIRGTSLGVGICFAHFRHPFAQTQEWAHTAMRVAKKSVDGKQAAVSWVDLTAEDCVSEGRHRLVDRLDRLRDGRPEGSDVVTTMSNSARAVLGSVVDLGFDRTETDPKTALVLHARRNREPELEAWLEKSWAGSDTGLAELRDSLSLSRWWPGPEPVATVSTPVGAAS